MEIKTFFFCFNLNEKSFYGYVFYTKNIYLTPILNGSCRPPYRWNTVLKKPLFPAFSAVLIENRLDIIVYGFAREKIVWFGKVLIMQALSSDVVLNWTVFAAKNP